LLKFQNVLITKLHQRKYLKLLENK